MSLRFEWDEAKARANAKKLGVTFEEASSVFADPLAAIFTERDKAIRIISVRQATTRERRGYKQRPIG